VKLEQEKDLTNTLYLTIPEKSQDDLFYSRSKDRTHDSSRQDEEDSLTAAAASNRYKNIHRYLSRNIGGLSNELDSIVRRLLLTRQLKPSTLSSMGLSHVKGVLLYGPPGTGKTLLAREMARSLNARQPKIVNGPEVMDKYVGEAERNIRALFQDAEKEWKRRGSASALHVVIFDEIDAIARRRGSLVGDGSGTRDSCVNQLLTQLDGISQVNNVLVIGLTNRRDLLDPALLRAGRFEVQVQVNPPSEEGRREVLAVLLRPLVRSRRLEAAVAMEWIAWLADRTDGWTGADLAGLVRSAASFALQRHFLKGEDDGSAEDEENIRLVFGDFLEALQDVSKLSAPSRPSLRKRLTAPFRRLMRSRSSSPSPQDEALLQLLLNDDDEMEQRDFLPDYQDTPDPIQPPQAFDLGGSLIF